MGFFMLYRVFGVMNCRDSKTIVPLNIIDHSTIDYEPFNKVFYQEHEEISNMEKAQIKNYRNNSGIKVSWTRGDDPPPPGMKFEHFNLPFSLMKSIAKAGYTEPTPIQSQAITVALSGRDIIGIAKTGSGKTAAFILPMMVHILDQRKVKKGEGPIGIILSPTRELARQIYNEARKFSKSSNLNVCAIYGGMKDKKKQVQALKARPDMVIGTPGRIMDMIKLKVLKMNRMTFCVLDEADKMLDMGFAPQVQSILQRVRPDRQTLMFSATFKRKVEELAKTVLSEPVRITVGTRGAANSDITQIVHIMNDESEKWPWIMNNIANFLEQGSLLIFVTQKYLAEQLSDRLLSNNVNAAFIHGDIAQNERVKIAHSYKHGEIKVLVATDVFSRGIDIKKIRNVINYQPARDIDSHTHRIGRTGRAGQEGHAYSLLTYRDIDFAVELVENLEISGQSVPPELVNLARKSKNWKYKRDNRRVASTISRGKRGRSRNNNNTGPQYADGYAEVTFVKGNNEVMSARPTTSSTVNSGANTDTRDNSRPMPKTNNISTGYTPLRENKEAKEAKPSPEVEYDPFSGT
eukprot:TRINITY_DN7090_c0_g2_i2.p1 TRINITY_DN7090_c0_g2~~TRINITY_DN7090_c0_g2_i2.p1  ORF type:complete len:576 (-),score=128.39 TRINITY_DN7090_c0_g2_i2:36-1763(-)